MWIIIFYQKCLLIVSKKSQYHNPYWPERFYPWRYIGENVIEILPIIVKLEIEDKPDLLISIDFYKAFDTIEWSFIQNAFKFFNFPEYLTKWIEIIYTNINSRIINNGHMLEGFK